MLYVIVGTALLAYAIYAHDLIPGLTLLILIILGVLTLASGAYGHCVACQALRINTNKEKS